MLASVLGLPTNAQLPMTCYPQIVCTPQTYQPYTFAPPVYSTGHVTSLQTAAAQTPRMWVAGNKLYMQSGPSKTVILATGQSIPPAQSAVTIPPKINASEATPLTPSADVGRDTSKLPVGVTGIYSSDADEATTHVSAKSVVTSLPPEVETPPGRKHVTHITKSRRPLAVDSLAPFLAPPPDNRPAVQPSQRSKPSHAEPDTTSISLETPTADVEMPSLPHLRQLAFSSGAKFKTEKPLPKHAVIPSWQRVESLRYSNTRREASLEDEVYSPKTIEQLDESINTQQEHNKRSGAFGKFHKSLVSLRSSAPTTPARVHPAITKSLSSSVDALTAISEKSAFSGSAEGLTLPISAKRLTSRAAEHRPVQARVEPGCECDDEQSEEVEAEFRVAEKMMTLPSPPSEGMPISEVEAMSPRILMSVDTDVPPRQVNLPSEPTAEQGATTSPIVELASPSGVFSERTLEAAPPLLSAHKELSLPPLPVQIPKTPASVELPSMPCVEVEIPQLPFS